VVGGDGPDEILVHIAQHSAASPGRPAGRAARCPVFSATGRVDLHPAGDAGDQQTQCRETDVRSTSDPFPAPYLSTYCKARTVGRRSQSQICRAGR
jgi:hypothetical protein